MRKIFGIIVLLIPFWFLFAYIVIDSNFSTAIKTFVTTIGILSAIAITTLIGLTLLGWKL